MRQFVQSNETLPDEEPKCLENGQLLDVISSSVYWNQSSFYTHDYNISCIYRVELMIKSKATGSPLNEKATMEVSMLKCFGFNCGNICSKLLLSPVYFCPNYSIFYKAWLIKSWEVL